MLEWLRTRINDAHAQQSELTPCLGRRRSPRILDVYKVLPGTNCRRCGEATCMALAARLIFGEASPVDCPALAEAQFARNRALLAEWLGLEAGGSSPTNLNPMGSDPTNPEGGRSTGVR